MKYFDLAWACFQSELKMNDGRATFSYGEEGYSILSWDEKNNRRVTQYPDDQEVK